MNIDTESLHTCIKYLDMITFEDPKKIKKMPALPEGIRLEGEVSETDFMSYLNKLLKKTGNTGTSMLFGYLECDGTTI